jgi:hypothetical protein
MAHMAIRNRVPKTATALNLRSHSIDKLNHYDRRIQAGSGNEAKSSENRPPGNSLGPESSSSLNRQAQSLRPAHTARERNFFTPHLYPAGD